MNSLLWFIIIGAIFYFLMAKVGCGAHGHGGHSGDHDDQSGHNYTGDWITRDPVCGMKGAVSKAPESTEYRGMVYHFCSTRCRELFERNPDRYIDGGGHDHGSH